MTATPTKICIGCGERYTRPIGASKITNERWSQRRYCTKGCGAKHAGVSIERQSRGPDAAFDAEKNRITNGTASLLTLQMGMYKRIAQERGLNSVWESAVVLGMAA